MEVCYMAHHQAFSIFPFYFSQKKNMNLSHQSRTQQLDLCFVFCVAVGVYSLVLVDMFCLENFNEEG